VVNVKVENKTGTIFIMSTLRIRGIYAAALTQLFRQYNTDWDIVQPDDEIRACVAHAWRMDSPDVDIEDEPDEQGRREVIRMSGLADAVTPALRILQQHCLDVIAHQESIQLGAIYMGLVGLYSQVRRRAIVYMGDGLAGVLPLRYEDRALRVGTYLPVRIAAPPAEGDDRPELSTSITVPGHYAVLTSATSVRLSKQITDAEQQERLKRLGAAQDTGSWGIIWRTAAQHAEDHVLVTELQRLAQDARALRERLQATTTVGYIQGGDIVARVFLPGQAKAVCDGLRAELLPTLPGHHKYKAQGDVYSATVEALEKELPPEALRARTRTLSVLTSVDAMQQPIHNQVRLLVRDLHGGRQEQDIGQLAAFDIHDGWVELRQPLRHKDAYPPGFPIDKQPGDYTLTRFQEGSWSYIMRFYGRNNEWKGDYACLTTPIAIFADQLHVVDLHTAVWQTPQHTPIFIGLETLQRMQQQDVITATLTAKIQAEGERLLQEWHRTETA
jgi:hypothetical protein